MPTARLTGDDVTTAAARDRTVQAGPNVHLLVELIQLYSTFKHDQRARRARDERLQYRADVYEHLLVLKVTSDQTRTCSVVNSSNSFVNSSNGRGT